jgi:hypothetical protein
VNAAVQHEEGSASTEPPLGREVTPLRSPYAERARRRRQQLPPVPLLIE